MTSRPLVTFPDPRLKQVAAPVTLFDDELRILALDLVDTLRAAPGIGITAGHVGVPLRVVVLELPDDPEPSLYVNPEVVWASDELQRHAEGSVSMPGVTEEIERPAKIRLRYQDLEGTFHEEETGGLRAVCHQHEIDQLDGLFWLQRLSRLKRERVIKRYERLRKAG
ncbi:peptide deformylase [Ancylobacter oerskovii]|uniref:Peptide deformylase-like n=1 Tax=Ancylobacter oerskovii TaxID=459519 RepID=A0ABW4YZY9_9HYPH|nr:peptide deformylase [Ancylobacter oerskovii]MBS7541548.1 peptide deformylase [Ancylobacter oerskovii]